MKLQELVQPADLIFVHGTNWISKIIQKVTDSDINHVGIIYNDRQVFETDLKWGKASFRDLNKYNNVQVIVLRPTYICTQSYIQQLCEKYNKTPYSFLDILTNFLLSPFDEHFRKKVVALIGTKKYAICSELTTRIFYEASRLEYLKGYEGYTPQDLLTTCLDHPEHFQVVLDQISGSIPPSEE